MEEMVNRRQVSEVAHSAVHEAAAGMDARLASEITASVTLFRELLAREENSRLLSLFTTSPQQATNFSCTGAGAIVAHTLEIVTARDAHAIADNQEAVQQVTRQDEVHYEPRRGGQEERTAAAASISFSTRISTSTRLSCTTSISCLANKWSTSSSPSATTTPIHSRKQCT